MATMAISPSPLPSITVPPTSQPTSIPEPTWREIAAMPVSRSEMAAATIGEQIYLAGGLTNQDGQYFTSDVLEVYDPTANTWQTAAPLPEPRHHAMVAAYDGLLYFFGGLTPSWSPAQQVWAYDPATDQWTERADLPQPNASGFAVTTDDAIYVVGGTFNGRSLWRYVPNSDQWESLAEMNEQREHVSAAVFDGEIYVFGGRWGVNGERGSAEKYTPATNSWSFLLDMPEPRAGHATVTYQNTILVIGGEIEEGKLTLQTIDQFDPATSAWQSFEPLPLPAHGVPAAVVNDALYILSGSRRGFDIFNDGRSFVYSSDN